ncbi:MAG TPA: ATP-binding protein, partial [Bryobacteraceae bacterium]|nr:ATP-binding protein [Bryobacteraceae bacterium]
MKESERTGVRHSPRAARATRPSVAKPATTVPLGTNSQFNALFDSSGEALVVVNPAGELQKANRPAREMLGLGHKSLRRAELGEFVEPPAIGGNARIWTQLFSAARVETLEGVLPTGLPVRFILRAVLPVSGDLLLCVEPNRPEPRGQGKWPPLEGKLLQTEKMAALGHLVSGIAHELNNPLTAIMGYAQLLLGHGLAPAQQAEADKVYQEAERARRIVKNLLYFARETKTERTRVNLNEIVERTLALRSYELRVENIAVETDLDPALPVTMADPYQLQQVVLNLLVNAEQALLEGRGRGLVTIRTFRSATPAGERILLEVSDDGPGIPRAHASRIFDPFFTTKPPGVGTGLGLSIVYGIVQQHGGEVTCESRPGGGARFTVDLPVVAAPSTEE